MKDFRDFFSNRDESKVSASTSTPAVSAEGFREYYRDVGVCEPYDSVFVPTIEARMSLTQTTLCFFDKVEKLMSRTEIAYY